MKRDSKTTARLQGPAHAKAESRPTRVDLNRVFTEAYRALKSDPLPPFGIRFYPYTSLKHTARIRDGRLVVRLSDILEDAPLPVLTGAVAILLARLFQRKASDGDSRRYLSYVNSRRIRERALAVRSQRGRKELTSPVGKYFDLGALYQLLNLTYFDGRLQVKHLSWSRRPARRILGHWDPAHDAIIISRRLDHRRVPESVVAYVLFHEMLHAWFGIGTEGSRCRFHPPRFREAEMRFVDYDRARHFIRTRLA